MRPRRVKERPITRRNRRYVGIAIFFTFCLCFLLFRVWYYQAVWGDEYSVAAVRQETQRHINRVTRDIMPTRGSIVDRNMQPIAGSHQVFTVFLDVTEMWALHNRRLNNNVEENILEMAAEAIELALGNSRHSIMSLFETDFEGQLVNPTRHRVLARNVMPDVAIPLISSFVDIHGTEESLRWHHDPFFAPQVIGFIRGPYSWGLESHYDTELTGEAGRTFWVQGDVEEIPVRDGHTLVTTLDGDIQRLAQSYVDQTFIDHPSQFVGMIVMDPFTGEILAMAQAPTFSMADPMNIDLISDEVLRREMPNMNSGDQVAAMNRMWRNYHTNRSAEPGSVFKPVVIAAALEEGVIHENSHFYCPGFRDVLDQRVYCWVFPATHGSVSLREALYVSCNIAMAEINRLMGRDRFYSYRGYFGFADYTGIDMPCETDVSHPFVMYTRARLNPVELATSSIGQGFNTTTIQTINSYATLINGGHVLEPFFVSQIVDAAGNVVYHRQPTEVRRVISQQTSDFIRREMQYVVTAENGTARRLAVPGHAIGAKTGTGQQGARADGINNLTLVAYTPVENPEFLVLMIIDGDNTGASAGGTVAPVLSNFFQDLIRIRNLPPSDGPDAMDTWQAAQADVLMMPDFRGMRLADVVRDVNSVNRGGFHVIGEGITISHTLPAPGQQMPTDAPIFFHMDPDSAIPGLMTMVPDVVGLTVDQADVFLFDSGLPTPMQAVSQPLQGTAVANDAFPFTMRAQQIEHDATSPLPPRHVIYRQFPQPGTWVEQGTQILVRVR